MKVGLNTARGILCHSCRQLKPKAAMIHAYGSRMYCSKGCVAKARWFFTAQPLDAA